MIRYEANPPKVRPGSGAGDMERFVDRIARVSEVCDAIHLTENVLGYERVPPLEVGKMIMEKIPGITITATMRVRDKDAVEIDRLAARYASAGFSGVLVLMGDPSRDGKADSGQVPSAVVSRLGRAGYGTDLYLSVPSSPDYTRMGAKVRARPKGFVTQVIRDAGQVGNLADALRGFAIIPIILYPSEKNRKSAEFLGLDLDAYRPGFEDLVQDSLRMTGDVLVTSPGDFEGVCGFLGTL